MKKLARFLGTHWLALTLTFFILWGVGVRLYRFGTVPIGTYWDETAILMDARSVYETGKDIHNRFWPQALYLSYGDYKLPVYIVATVPSLAMLGAVPAAVRLPSLLAGLITICVVILLSKELSKRWSKQLQLWFVVGSTLSISLSYWAIHFSRVGFEGHLAQLLIALSMYCMFRSRVNPWWWTGSALAALLAFFTYYSIRFVWPILWLIIVAPLAFDLYVTRFQSLKKNRWQLVGAGLSITIFLMGWVVMINSPYYDASEQFRMSSPSILTIDPYVEQANQAQTAEGETPFGSLVFNRRVYQAKAFATQISTNLSLDTLFLSGDSNPRHGSGFQGLFPLAFAPFLLLGIISLLRHHKKTLFYLGVWWLVAVIPASVSFEVPHALRALNALVPVSLLIGYGIGLFLKWSMQKKYQYLIIGFCVLVGFEMFRFSYHYFTVYPLESAREWQSGYQELADHVWNNRDQVDYAWVNVGDDRFFLWLLAYTDTSIMYIQQDAVWNDSKLRSIENISFEDFIYDNSLWPTKPFFLAGRRSQLLSNLEIIKKQPSKIVSIADSNGVEQFVVAYFNIRQ